MASKELDDPLQLIVVLRRVGEKGVVTTSVGVMRLDWFVVPSQRRFEVTRQRDPRVYATATGWSVSSAMQDENRHIELRGAGRRPIRVARGMKNGGLHVADGQDVLQGFAAAA